jgi:pyridoxine kinase
LGKNILLINDMPGYGNVALQAAVPVLSGYVMPEIKHNVFALPTALISNTLNYGRHSILDTTDYMTDALETWHELGFSFDAISTGFIVSEKQADLIADFCASQKENSKNKVKIFVDPIMADNGRLYNSITPQHIQIMRKMMQISDYVTPNYTEAVFLADKDIANCFNDSMNFFKEENPHSGSEYDIKSNITEVQAYSLLDALISKGAKSIIITGAVVNDESAVVLYDSTTRDKKIITYTPVLGHFAGTGDYFSAVFTGCILNGLDMTAATKKAMAAVHYTYSKT